MVRYREQLGRGCIHLLPSVQRIGHAAANDLGRHARRSTRQNRSPNFVWGRESPTIHPLPAAKTSPAPCRQHLQRRWPFERPPRWLGPLAFQKGDVQVLKYLQYSSLDAFIKTFARNDGAPSFDSWLDSNQEVNRHHQRHVPGKRVRSHSPVSHTASGKRVTGRLAVKVCAGTESGLLNPTAKLIPPPLAMIAFPGTFSVWQLPRVDFSEETAPICQQGTFLKQHIRFLFNPPLTLIIIAS